MSSTSKDDQARMMEDIQPFMPLSLKIKHARTEVDQLQERMKFLEEELLAARQKYNTAKNKLDALCEQERTQTTEEAIRRTNRKLGVTWMNQRFEWSTTLRQTLVTKFHLIVFRPMQLAAINAAMANKDVIAVLPTGAGKSLIYQMVAVMKPGYVIVIVPLISLAYDQVLALSKLGIEAKAYNSSTPQAESRAIFDQLTDANTKMKALFVTPEMLAKNKRMISLLQKAHEMKLISRIVIDEVHCCSTWGHDFRPDYQYLGVFGMALEGVPVLGLTATATYNVLNDILKILTLRPDPVILTASYNRPNLYYEVIFEPNLKQHIKVMMDVVKRHPDQSGLIYCNNIRDSFYVAQDLKRAGITASAYNTDMSQEERNKAHEKWLDGRVKIIVATAAFGMGIDKPDVRFVIHYMVPRNMVTYYQESGRAGRDGKAAYCVIIYALADFMKMIANISSNDAHDKAFDVLRYCLEQKRCRREIIAKNFNEVWEPSHCELMCDMCRGEAVILHEYDLSSICRCLQSIVIESTERLTLIKLYANWVKRNKKIYKVNINREEFEFIVSFLLSEDYLSVDRGYNMYTGIGYIKQGKLVDEAPIKLISRRAIEGLPSTVVINEQNRSHEQRNFGLEDYPPPPPPSNAASDSEPSVRSAAEPIPSDLTISSNCFEDDEGDYEEEIRRIEEASSSSNNDKGSRRSPRHIDSSTSGSDAWPVPKIPPQRRRSMKRKLQGEATNKTFPSIVINNPTGLKLTNQPSKKSAATAIGGSHTTNSSSTNSNTTNTSGSHTSDFRKFLRHAESREETPIGENASAEVKKATSKDKTATELRGNSVITKSALTETKENAAVVKKVPTEAKRIITAAEIFSTKTERSATESKAKAASAEPKRTATVLEHPLSLWLSLDSDTTESDEFSTVGKPASRDSNRTLTKTVTTATPVKNMSLGGKTNKTESGRPMATPQRRLKKAEATSAKTRTVDYKVPATSVTPTSSKDTSKEIKKVKTEPKKTKKENEKSERQPEDDEIIIITDDETEKKKKTVAKGRRKTK